MNQFDIEEYVGEHVRISKAYDGDNGRELLCECPFCGGSSRHREPLGVNADTGQWVCYRCRMGGGIVDLVASVEGISRPKAYAFVLHRTRVKLPRAVSDVIRAPEPEPEPPKPLTLPDEFLPIYDRQTGQVNMPVYLRQRGVKLRTALAYGLGYCLAGRYAGRLVLPVRMFGKLHSYQARAMGPFGPPYIFPRGSGAGSIFGLDQAVGSRDVIVVEGPMDVLTLAQRGYNAVSTVGKNLSRAQALAIKHGGFRRATIVYDGDALNWAAYAAARLSELLDEVQVADLPPEHDPDSAPADVLKAALLSACCAKLARRGRKRY